MLEAFNPYAGWRWLPSLLLYWALVLPAWAAPGAVARTPHVRAELLAAQPAVSPGQEIWLGVRQEIIPHWHTYWRNPGDSGQATSIRWQVPASATVGPIQWPLPQRVRMGPITNYAYAGEVSLLSAFKVPADQPVGQPLQVSATVDWLVCEEECIPESVELRLSLPVLAQADAVPPPVPIQRALESLPQSGAGATLSRLGDASVRLSLAGDSLAELKSAWFFPSEWGALQQSAEQAWRVSNGQLTIDLPLGDKPPKVGESLPGVLVVERQTQNGLLRQGYELAPRLAAASPAFEWGALFWAMLAAMLGGIALNLMPCVFPVLSIKALALLKHAQATPRELRLQGLVYAAGVLSAFALLAAVLILLKAGGQSIGWGFQYQSPLFVWLLALLMFAVGLSLSGCLSFGAGVAGLGSELAEQGGYRGSFFTGVLAAVVATPCTAPFMGAAIGYALGQPALVLLAVFLSLGGGLALPYLVLTFWPGLQRRLPRPGPWMERLKECFAFPMYAAAIWLVWVLAQQAGPNAVLLALVAMLLLGFAAWLLTNASRAGPLARRLCLVLATAAALLALFGGAWRIAALQPSAASEPEAATAHWEAFTPERLKSLRAEGKPVFVNMTAAWCISCLVNERVALSDAAIVEAFKRSGLAYLKGDWTQRDARISAFLQAFGRSGVPLYVYYPAGLESEPVVLPQLLTPEIVREHLFPSAPILKTASQKESS